MEDVMSVQDLNQPPLVNGQHPIIANASSAVTSTTAGKVAGYCHRDVYAFKGIPYAKAERFMPPSKPDAWDGVRSSRAYGPVCPIDVSSMILSDEMEFAQQHNFWIMNENCQNLNIWTQGLNDGKKRPVMVWLHGGGYFAGSSCELPTYHGENLCLKGDVVVVSLNHRLNALGFLDLSTLSDKYARSANVGMMDIIEALKWVRENIENFGGDPKNVTIFGQSGGAGKVATLMYAPSAKGLFHRAIMQSGGFANFKPKEQSVKIGPAILEELGIKPEDVDRLTDIPFDKLLAAGNAAYEKMSDGARGMMGLSWSPSIDEVVFPLMPGEAGAEDINRDVPLMIGTNKTEFNASMMEPGLFSATESQVKEHLSQRYGDKTDEFIATYKETYPEAPYPSDMIDFDMLFRPGTIKFTELRSAIPGGAPVYSWLFKWNAPILDGLLKSLHCMEIAFVFDNIARNEEYNGGTPEAYALADKMSETWASFARLGDPNNPKIPSWEPYTTEGGATMLFDNTCEVKHHHDRKLYQIAGVL